MTKRSVVVNSQSTIIIKAQGLRVVVPSELRTPFNGNYPIVYDFYLDRLGYEIYEQELNFHRIERISRIIPHFCNFKISSLPTRMENVPTKYYANSDYYFMMYSENSSLLLEAANDAIPSHGKMGGFCKKKDILNFCNSHKQLYSYKEMGSLSV